jgi:hypothetical protein
MPLSKIEVKLRKKLKLIVGTLSEGNSLKFLKNRQNFQGNNRRKTGPKKNTLRVAQPHPEQIKSSEPHIEGD